MKKKNLNKHIEIFTDDKENVVKVETLGERITINIGNRLSIGLSFDRKLDTEEDIASALRAIADTFDAPVVEDKESV